MAVQKAYRENKYKRYEHFFFFFAVKYFNYYDGDTTNLLKPYDSFM